MVKNFKKGTSILLVGLIALLIFTGSIIVGADYKINNSAATDTVTEDVLLQKDNLIKTIIQYEDGINPYWSTAKATALSKMETSKIESLVNKGYSIYINTARANNELPEPIKVSDNKVIIVSIYSNNDELINVINNLI